MNGSRNAGSTLQLGNAVNIATDKTITNDYILGGYFSSNTFCYNNLIAAGDANLLNSSIYFKRNGLGLGCPAGTKQNTNTIEFLINSQSVCQLSLLQAYEETLKAFELNDTDMPQINPGIRDLVLYEKDFFACALSTSHINNRDPTLGYLLSGRNTQATSLNIVVNSINNRGTDNAQAATPCIVTEFSSVLLVKAHRNIALMR
jgi:hypothetical protein